MEEDKGPQKDVFHWDLWLNEHALIIASPSRIKKLYLKTNHAIKRYSKSSTVSRVWRLPVSSSPKADATISLFFCCKIEELEHITKEISAKVCWRNQLNNKAKDWSVEFVCDLYSYEPN